MVLLEGYEDAISSATLVSFGRAVVGIELPYSRRK
jgi:hypothetical protein